MDKVKQKALTFDDVLLLPSYSDFLPSEASTQTKPTYPGNAINAIQDNSYT